MDMKKKEYELKAQRKTIETNFKNLIKVLENGSDNRLYGFIIPMFRDIIEDEFFIDRKLLILAIKEFRKELITEKEVAYEGEFIKSFQRNMKKEDIQKMFESMIMSYLLGFLETNIISGDRHSVLNQNIKRKKNRKKKEQKTRNKWKKPPSPEMDYKTYDWNVPSFPPPSYAPPLPAFLPCGKKL